jgi:hypothetical protein
VADHSNRQASFSTSPFAPLVVFSSSFDRPRAEFTSGHVIYHPCAIFSFAYLSEIESAAR